MGRGLAHRGRGLEGTRLRVGDGPDRPLLGRACGHRRRRPRALDRVAPRAPRRGRPRGRQDRRRRRRIGHRLRGGAQQLLPARDGRAHGGLRRGLGVRARRPALPRHRVSGARAAGAGVRPGGGLRASAADWLPVAADRRRGGGRRAHAGHLPRLASAGAERVPARARGRVRLQPRVDDGPRRPRARGRGADRRGRRGHRLRGRRRRRGRCGADERRGHRGDGRRGRRRRSLDPRAVGAARPAGARAGRRRGARDVDLLVPPGGRGGGEPRRLPDGRGRTVARSSTSTARRLCTTTTGDS